MSDEPDDHTSTADLPPSDPALAPGSPHELGKLGKYRVLKMLGKGGMGAVYLGHDDALDRKVALKVMLPKFSANRSARERFTREAKVAAKIQSDHVVTIFDVGEDAGTPYLAMELLQGVPLDEYLKTHEAPTIPQILRIGREAAAGLAAAHERGLVHRDIKPSNLWLEAPKGRVKILDFGLAREQEDDTHLTGSGAVVGTPAYMAPEQARGEKVDARTDIFSLGAVLYRLAAGRLPFPGRTQMEVLTRLAMEDPPPVREFNPAVPEALADLIHRMLAKKPINRPSSAEVVASALVNMDHRNPDATPTHLVPPVYFPVAVTMAPSPESAFEGIDESSVTQATVTPEGGPTTIKVRKPAEPGGVPWVLILSLLFAGLTTLLAVGVLWKVLKPDPVAVATEAPKPTPPRTTPTTKPPDPQPPLKPGEVVLFNGTNLDGWDGDPKVWRVKSRAIHGGKVDGTEPTFLKSKQSYRDFELEFEYEASYESGRYPVLKFRTPESDLNAGLGLRFTTDKGVAFSVPGKVEVNSGRLRSNESVPVTIKAIGRHVTVKVRGTTLFDESLDAPQEGIFAWGLVPEKAEMSIRKVRFTDLSDPAVRNRKVAEVLIQIAQVEVAFVGRADKKMVSQGGQLPDEPFLVEGIQNPRTLDVGELFGAIDDLRSLRFVNDFANGVNWGTYLERLSESPGSASIEALGLPSLPLTGKSLPVLKRFPKLKSLHVYGGNVDDDTLLELSTHFPNMSVLYLHQSNHCTKFTERGMKAVASLPLEKLTLGVPAGYGKSFAGELARLQNLTYLSLEFANAADITDMLAALSKCKSLESLALGDTKIEDKHLKMIETLSSLRSLNLKQTSITAKGAAAFAAARPDVKITGAFPEKNPK